jgi:hypothetical protein
MGFLYFGFSALVLFRISTFVFRVLLDTQILLIDYLFIVVRQ